MAAHINILIGEPDDFFMDWYNEILGKYPCCDATFANNGESLVNEFVRGNGEYDIVIAAKEMPHMSGVQAIKEIKKRVGSGGLKPAMYLAVTRMEYHRVESDALQAGATGVMIKPLQVDDFGVIIDQYINQYKSK